MKKAVYLLTGDIGGTNSRMFLYTSSGSHEKPLAFHTFRNAEHIPADCHGDETIFQRKIIVPFLQGCWEKQLEYGLVDIEQAEILAVLAVAGVVQQNAVRVTNLGSMLVDGNRIAADNHSSPFARAIGSCTIINDFVAQGYGCLTLQPNEVRHLYGRNDNVLNLPHGPKVCIGAGTGLGECYLTTNNNNTTTTTTTTTVPQYTCFPSEGGHVEFSPRNDLEIRLFQYLIEKFSSNDRISVERVVSGIGLANVYEFLATREYPEQVDPIVHQEFLAAKDEKGRVVANHVHDNELCRISMSIFMSAYGREAGSAALKWIPTGGLFVSGGVTPKNINLIQGSNSDFMLAYRNKGRVSPLLEMIPLFAVMVEDLGVRGAHKAARMEYEQRTSSPTKQPYTTTTTSKGKEGSFISTSTSFAHSMSVQCWAGVFAMAIASFGLGVMLGRRQQL